MGVKPLFLVVILDLVPRISGNQEMSVVAKMPSMCGRGIVKMRGGIGQLAIEKIYQSLEILRIRLRMTQVEW